MLPAQSSNCSPELPVTPGWRSCGAESDILELRAGKQVVDIHLICCLDHIVQSQGAVGKSALEDAHLPQLALRLPG